MSDTTYVDFQTPAVNAAWLNDLNNFFYRGLVYGSQTYTFNGPLSYSDTNVLGSFASSVNSFNQVIIQNKNAGAVASASLVLSNDQGTANTNYADLGINSSTFAGVGSFNKPGAVFLAAATTDLVIGTYGANAIHFVVNNGATDAGGISPTGVWSISYTIPAAGAVATDVIKTLSQAPVTPYQFGAVGDGVTLDTTALLAMAATGLPWLIPNGTFLCDQPLVFTASGTAYGQITAKTGFSGKLVSIVNPTYGKRLLILGLNVYSADVRPNPYTGAASTGIYVGPSATYLGNTPCPNVTLIGARSTRFSYGIDVATFNVDCYSCQFFQNDHNARVYSTDLTNNQINDVRFFNCAMDSASSSVGQAYALRVGTSGNGTYVSSVGMGYNLKVYGCNFDGAPVYVDNVIGFDFRSYCEQASGYTYHGGALVLGSAGANTLQDVNISQSTFIQFDYAVVEKNTVLGLVVGPNNCSAVKYRELLAVACEAQGFRYIRGTSVGSFNANGDPVGTNFSSGISTSQITFSGITIDSDFLTNGTQLAPMTTSTTSWYPRGLTLDGNQNLASSVGRFRSGSAVQSAIAGNQVGQVFTFTTQAQASLFNGGDTITSSAGGASKVFSVDYVAGTAVLDSSFTGACTLSHTPVYFVGYNLSGSGSPVGVVTANPGSRYINISGGAGTTTYVKETGTGTNTGWVAK